MNDSTSYTLIFGKTNGTGAAKNAQERCDRVGNSAIGSGAPPASQRAQAGPDRTTVGRGAAAGTRKRVPGYSQVGACEGRIGSDQERRYPIAGGRAAERVAYDVIT
ncbi:hypothetical protein GGF43_003459, partial [Coemansia sp. RSA 2618]